MRFTTLLPLALALGLTTALPEAGKGGGGGAGDAAEIGAEIIQGLATGDVQVDLFNDGNCQKKFSTVTVRKNSCYTGSSIGWSSMRVTGVSSFNIGGTITGYTKNNCGCPTCGSHGYSINDQGCLRNFGFTANAVGVGGY